MSKRGSQHTEKLKAYARYSGMAFQLFAMLGIAYLLGSYLDKQLNNSTAIATAICLFAAIFMYLYAVIRDTKK